MHSQVHLQSRLMMRELMELLGGMQAFVVWLPVFTHYTISGPKSYMFGGQSFRINPCQSK